MKLTKADRKPQDRLLGQVLYPVILLSLYVDYVGHHVEASAASSPQGHSSAVSFNLRPVLASGPGGESAGGAKRDTLLHSGGFTSAPASLDGSVAAPLTFPQDPRTASSSGDNKPYFDDISPRNVTTVVDDMAVLKCRVKHKGNRTVSWMRKRDLHILTSGTHTYTGDQRFSVHHMPDTEDWDLRIAYAQPRDSGIYECQVNTEPKINLAVNLHVTAARAKILGSQEAHVRKGSTISLSCVVNFHAPSITWYHGTAIVNFDSARGGISLETEKTEAGTSSRLLLTKATVADSGNYTCVPSGAIPASVQVYVLHGEHPAAMQTSGKAVADPSSVLLLITLGLTALLTKLISKINDDQSTIRTTSDPTTMTIHETVSEQQRRLTIREIESYCR
ncbi:zwei Ig domain protein zig-8-like [Uranotaenia lowii]|uniref:zwei Ig domain protein zig-8-like n=1 Tax=Uranotaenia lowii TaxID=190385 RepID=UPI002478CBB1|nr:zwei Ig domain protein zig-8-like [Uranotaenia lowii]XP_055608630.1 zwei Ig domain protein zig-8-like [Uranotaenia lowii]XP_055608631.1 zwei Ig domain protein zig-8-like [Uranotaenia lowii]